MTSRPSIEGAYWIVNKSNGSFLGIGATTGGLVLLSGQDKIGDRQTLADHSQMWLFEPLTDGVSFRIRNAQSGDVFDVKESAIEDGVPVIIYQQTNKPNQHWNFEWIDDADGTAYYRVNNNSTKKALTLTTGSGNPAVSSTWNNGEQQRWAFEPVVFPPVYWISHAQTGWYLKYDKNNSSAIVGDKISPTDASRSQLWFLESIGDDNAWVIRSVENDNKQKNRSTSPLSKDCGLSSSFLSDKFRLNFFFIRSISKLRNRKRVGRYGDNEIISSSSDEEFTKGMDQMKDAKPPRHVPAIRHCASTARLVDSSVQDLDLISPSLPRSLGDQAGFLPVFRSGSCSEIGRKAYMEDEHICIDNILGHLGAGVDLPAPGAFYGVFDGHDGLDAASFVRDNLLRFIIEDRNFPTSLEKAMNCAFETTDHAFSDSPSLDSSSGTTVLAALILGRTMLIANAGDCRAVLGRRGRAVELSRDHKPNSRFERLRIEKLGGMVCDGYLNYLNGQLSVSRALGDWHMKGPKGSASPSPLSAEPELQEIILTEEDEFLIMGCDGLWDVMSSQYAVTIVRRELMAHNDPERCSRELVREALKMDACDNLTVVVVCFSSSPPPRIEIPKSQVRRSISLEGLFLLKGVLDSND